MIETIYYLLIVLVVLLIILFLTRIHFDKKFMVQRYNRRAIKIISDAPNMNMEELMEAHSFLHDEEISSKIKSNFLDSAKIAITVRETILLSRKD